MRLFEPRVTACLLRIVAHAYVEQGDVEQYVGHDKNMQREQVEL